MSGVGKSDRAPPRKRKDSMEDQQPQFLRKAYYMMENCNPEIDGFRKVRSDLNQNALWWEFKHPLFRRGHPELLVEIKKSVHFESQAANPTGSGENVKELHDEMRTLKEQMRMMETMVREMAMRSNLNGSQQQLAQPQIGIAPHHVGGGVGMGMNMNMNVGMGMGGMGQMAGGVQIGIPLNMMGQSPMPITKKRQRVSSNADVVPMQPAAGAGSGGMPVFYDGVLAGGTITATTTAANTAWNQSSSSSSVNVSVNVNTFQMMGGQQPGQVDEGSWVDMMEFFDGNTEGNNNNNNNVNGACASGNNNDMFDGDVDEDEEVDLVDFDSGVAGVGGGMGGYAMDTDMMVAPTTIVMNEPSINHWEWAAVGQLLDEEGQQNCQVDQLADALLFHNLDRTIAGSVNSIGSNNNNDGSATATATMASSTQENDDQMAKATAAQLDGLYGAAAGACNVDALISGLLLLPLELQQRFVDRLADVLGKQLADHLGRQAEVVQMAMVEASFGGPNQGIYAKKEESLMDVSHYAQVITSHSNPNTPISSTTSVDSTGTAPPTVAAHVEQVPSAPTSTAPATTTTEVHALAQVIGTAASTMNQALPFVMRYGDNNDPTNMVIANQVSMPVPVPVPVPMSMPVFNQVEPSAPVLPSAPQLPEFYQLQHQQQQPPATQHQPLSSSAALLTPSNLAAITQQQQYQQQPHQQQQTQQLPQVAQQCFPCENCAHCRANALLNSYHPQELAVAYPLAAAALGALLLRWGEMCTRHRS